MKKFICLLLALTLLLLSSCTDKKSDISETEFLGVWQCEVYNTKEEKLGDMICEIKEKEDTYHGVINKFTDDDKSGIEFDDFFATDNELFFIKNNRVIEKKEYYFNNNKLIIGNNVFTRK